MNIPRSLHILVIEDNDGLREATMEFLQSHGHEVSGVSCAEDVDDTSTRDLPDLYLIDVNLPGENGFSLAKRIRLSQPLAGIVLVTARGQLDDRLNGYACGADNYLVKPMEQAELLGCIQNLGHRLLASRISQQDTPQRLSLNSKTMALSGPNGLVSLTRGESVVLAALCRAAGQKLERWQVMQIIDPTDKGMVTTNADMRIRALRKKLRAAGAPEGSIRTHWGFGYELMCDIQIL